MEFKINFFFLFLCLFNLVFLQTSYNLPKNDQIQIQGYSDASFLIQLTDNLDSYGEYIDITLSAEAELNPMIFIATDETCQNERLFIGIQIVEPIYSFIKKAQIKDRFYICIQERQYSNLSYYNLIIENQDFAYIPYDSQASYYISDSSMQSLSLHFRQNENSKVNSNSQVTFWVKGQSIKSATLDSADANSLEYENGKVFYGPFPSLQSNPNLIVESSIGDYVTIGSTIITDNQVRQMKKNANEMMIASKEEKVCIKIDYTYEILHITGKVYTKKIYAYFADDAMDHLELNETELEKNITNGIISHINIVNLLDGKIKEGYYCLENTENKLMVVAIQMTSNQKIGLVHQPLVPGEIRRHFLLQGEYAIFYGMKPKEGATELNLNLKTLKGFPEMYFDNCTTFPNCDYSETDSLSNLINPVPSNMMTVYSFYLNEIGNEEFNSISSYQPLMIVKCTLGGKMDFFAESMLCEFETSYFTNMDTVHIYQETTFSQYLLKGEDDNYAINLEGEENKILYLDLLLFSGDAEIKFNNNKDENNINKFYLSNKIFYSVQLNNDIKELDFSVQANNNTFYMIQYQFVGSSSNDDKNTIESGVNYITSKFLDGKNDNLKKDIELINFKYEFQQPYLLTFFSPNCKFSLNWKCDEEKTETIIENDYIAQTIIEPDNKYYLQQSYNLFYAILPSEDDSEIPLKYCMVYAAGLEISNSVIEWNQRSISLSEGVPHRYTFSKKHPFIFYSYYVSDTANTLVLKFKLIDKADFNIQIKINRKYFQELTIYRNSQIYIRKKDFLGKCEDMEVCSVLVSVEMQNSEDDRRVEVDMYQIDPTPHYLEKNAITQDVLHGNIPKHYYFEITDEECGDITLDFKRGSGFIYASVQERNLENPMDNPDWRGLYHFPKSINESLRFRAYGKRIEISERQTEKCSKGCYVLVTIVSNMNYYGDYIEDTVPFRISINPRIMKKDESFEVPKVRMEVNEFVIGEVYSNRTENRKYDYYTVTLPYESEYILIDWQADNPILIINVGDTRPVKGKANITFPFFGQDTVYRVNKSDIIEIAKLDKNAELRGVTLTLGIYSDINDSIMSSPYAFKLFMPPTINKETKAGAEIIHIRSDQKVQCQPFIYNDKNVCVFAVVFDDLDIYNALVLYPRNQEGSSITIYGKYVDAQSIEKNNVGEIEVLMEETFEKEAFKIEGNYFYNENVAKNKSFFFMITEESNSIMEVLSSTQLYYNNINIYPNPSTPQIFAIGNYNINLNFITRQDLLLNIVSVSGGGGFYWDSEKEKERKYYLDGFRDRLSLTTRTHDRRSNFAPLRVEPLPQYEEGGFIFYITYYPRSDIDQLKKDRAIEFNYRALRMPLYYYLPITKDNSLTVNFNFYYFYVIHNHNLEYDTNLFNIWATVISLDDAVKARLDPNNRPKYDSSNSIKGIFDSTFGNLFLSSDDINKIYEDNEDPALFFSIEKSSDVKSNIESLGFEINIFSEYQTNGSIQAPEGVYITGKLSNSKNNKHKFIYPLLCDKNRVYFTLEYAANSDVVNFALSTDADSEKNDNFVNMTIVQSNGKNILKLQLNEEFFSPDKTTNILYLIVFTNETNLPEKLDYFTFRYLSSDNPGGHHEFLEEKERNITCTKSNDNYTITFSPVKINETSYYIKAIYKDGFIDGEKLDSIAISESKGKNIQINNFPFKPDEKITLTFNSEKEVKYIKILARSNLYDQKLFYLYRPYEITDSGNNKGSGDDGSDDKIFYICLGIGIFLLVVVTALIVIVFLYNKKNKDLVAQVNKISFVESDAKERDDGNLLLDNSD